MTIKQIILLFSLILFRQSLFSQTGDINNNDKKHTDKIVRLSLLIPGISVETNFNEKFTLFTEIGAGYYLNVKNKFSVTLLYNSGMDENFTGTRHKFYPFGKIEERYYYNLSHRKEKNKSVANNSGNYISHYNLYILNEIILTGITWGIQRNVNKFYFNFNLGPALYLSQDELHATIISDIKLGFSF